MFTGVKIVTPKELRGHDSECQRLNHQLLDLSHIGEGVPKMHQSYTGWPKVFSESSCCAGLAAEACQEEGNKGETGDYFHCGNSCLGEMR